MTKTLKVRLYPNSKQATLINKTIGCCRFIFNNTLAFKKEQWQIHHASVFKYDAIKRIPTLKNLNSWLKEVDAIALQQAVERLDLAYQSFFRKGGFPKFKSKKHDTWSYTTKLVGSNITVTEKAVKLPKLGSIKAKGIRPINGTIKTATITRTRSGKYMCSIVYEVPNMEHMPKTGNSVGIDLGIDSFITLSNGLKVSNPFYRAKSQAAIAIAQVKLSRKQRDSKGYVKAQQQLAKRTEWVVNQRHDFIHKLSRELVTTYDVICLEDLDVKSMMTKGSTTLPKRAEKAFHSKVTDVSWSELVTMLTYKAEWYGKQVVQVDRYYPSSQLCNQCGYQNEAVKDLSIREWVCPVCHSSHERDVNAAINIREEGLRLIRL